MQAGCVFCSARRTVSVFISFLVHITKNYRQPWLTLSNSKKFHWERTPYWALPPFYLASQIRIIIPSIRENHSVVVSGSQCTFHWLNEPPYSIQGKAKNEQLLLKKAAMFFVTRGKYALFEIRARTRTLQDQLFKSLGIASVSFRIL